MLGTPPSLRTGSTFFSLFAMIYSLSSSLPIGRWPWHRQQPSVCPKSQHLGRILLGPAYISCPSLEQTNVTGDKILRTPTKWTTFQEKDGQSTWCTLPKDKQKESNIHIRQCRIHSKKALNYLGVGEERKVTYIGKL